MKWQGVGFDLDNTLFSHELAFKKAIKHCYILYLNKFCQSKPIVSTETFFSLFKINSDKYWYLIEEKGLTKREYRRIRFNETMKSLGLPYGDHIADFFHNNYEECVDDYSEPYSGLYELLSLLKNKKIILAIITNGTRKTQCGKIERLKLNKWIQKNNIIISEDVGYEKPEKEIFNCLQKRLQLHSKELLYIGDSWKHDVVGAMDAGWDSIFLNTRNEKRNTNHKPLGEFHTLEEVTSYFLSI
ncbi:HAD-IA family hydrolase [Evansella sp. AB-P1]|uniref:HAD family hydrolase n=1 Tax=Evansella sp. AB-P1 TaxID=3037653 RepID=UPI00241E2B84|nr:HAD-IA family hydrolase [Evansella sp. AB-P1]MDG5788744.1 HAD-IA family hydrolase [Evansella sp. AB-P1]